MHEEEISISLTEVVEEVIISGKSTVKEIDQGIFFYKKYKK
jgi:hypothetical protein